MRLQKEIPLQWSGISFFYQCWMLEQFQLLPRVVRLMRFGTVKQLNVAKLLIGYYYCPLNIVSSIPTHCRIVVWMILC